MELDIYMEKERDKDKEIDMNMYIVLEIGGK